MISSISPASSRSPARSLVATSPKASARSCSFIYWLHAPREKRALTRFLAKPCEKRSAAEIAEVYAQMVDYGSIE
jgi:hypothetical protein